MHSELSSVRGPNDTDFFDWRGAKGRIDTFAISGPILLTLTKYRDRRGSFLEYFNAEFFHRLGLPNLFPQANLSETYSDVIRGMHFQTKNPQGKLVYCITGSIQDVCLDMRPWSPTYRSHLIVNLSQHPELMQFLYVPPQFAHGFLAREKSIVGYFCSTQYDKDSEAGIHPFKSGIDWGPCSKNACYLVGDRDNQLPSLVEYEKQVG